MKYEDLKPIFEKIEKKGLETERLEKIKILIDERTDKGKIKIMFEGQELIIDPNDLKAIVNKNVADNDITADLAELKNKVK